MSDDEVEDGIRRMKEHLRNADRDSRAARIRAEMDQLGARLRDMGTVEWEAVVQKVMEDTGLPEADARNWLGRLSGKCAEDDATWTGVDGMVPE